MIRFSRLHDHRWPPAAAPAAAVLAALAIPMACLGIPPQPAASDQPPAVAQQWATEPGGPIIINSAASNIDDATNTAEFTDIDVTQGATRLSAGHAQVTGVGFQDSRWQFVGRVVLSLAPGSSLKADQASLEYRDGKLVQVKASGAPASFEQQRANSQPPRQGHADEITYDLVQQTVQLQGHAQLSDNHGVQISAPAVLYHVPDDRWQAESETRTRSVHVTVTP